MACKEADKCAFSVVSGSGFQDEHRAAPCIRLMWACVRLQARTAQSAKSKAVTSAPLVRKRLGDVVCLAAPAS